ncbi:unnamed protein product [Fraxinus pennsylvanica]|uniref:Uncharacterized protein n=1 Tax=Fraxinus pennsylvanica TaxID=56036 RepID=A0AAD1Z863_9LAMI|nr:unnamed protein product [Fraxinus pennsylvanica]
MFNSDRTKEGNIYTSSDNRESSWNNFNSSTNAISFGFVATLILILMFVIMVIVEHLFRPTNASEDDARSQSDSTQMQKLGDQETVQTSDASNFTILIMPGQQCPTFIVQPAPLPCQREAVSWPSH